VPPPRWPCRQAAADIAVAGAATTPNAEVLDTTATNGTAMTTTARAGAAASTAAVAAAGRWRRQAQQPKRVCAVRGRSGRNAGRQPFRSHAPPPPAAIRCRRTASRPRFPHGRLSACASHVPTLSSGCREGCFCLPPREFRLKCGCAIKLCSGAGVSATQDGHATEVNG
jgi:hypothetical protein